MIKEQEKVELKKLINESGIHGAIQALENKLAEYQRRKKLPNHQYAMLIEFARMRSELKNVQEKLEHLTSESEI